MLDTERERGGRAETGTEGETKKREKKKETRERKSRDGERIGRKRERGGG